MHYHSISDAEKKMIQIKLLNWYQMHKRDLPWRKTQDPYKIWLSEIMLQQTQVKTVVDYYGRFLKRFPNLQTLAEAHEDEVTSLWAGLGYYSRARNLHRAAQKIVAEHAGVFPSDPNLIHQLPGIGRYTLGAIASIAFGYPLPLVDGNVIRVYARLFALQGAPNAGPFQKKIWQFAEVLLDQKCPGDFNQALMELGATVCVPKKPLCLLCPLRTHCKALQNEPENYPGKKLHPQLQRLQRLAFIFVRDQQVLLAHSKKVRWLKGLWQLPGLFLKKEQNAQEVLRDFLLEIQKDSHEVILLNAHLHSITHHHITVLPHLIHWNQEVRPQSVLFEELEDFKWVDLSKIHSQGLPSADRKILEILKTSRSSGFD